jgi:hypothetical protein
MILAKAAGTTNLQVTTLISCLLVGVGWGTEGHRMYPLILEKVEAGLD